MLKLTAHKQCGFKKLDHSKKSLTAPRPRASGGFSSVQNAEKTAADEKAHEAEIRRKRTEDEAKAHASYLDREKTILQHEAAAESTRVASAPIVIHHVVVPVIEEDEPTGACDNYVIDMNAKDFGACKCGHKKGDHKKASLFAKSAAPKLFQASVVAPVSSAAGTATSKALGNRPPPSFATSGAKPLAPRAAPVVAHAPPPMPVKQVVKVPQPEPDAEPEPETEPEPELKAEVDPEPEAVAESAAFSTHESSEWDDNESAKAEEAAAPEEAAVEEVPAAVEEVAAHSQAEEAVIPEPKMLDPAHLYRGVFEYEGQEVEDLSFAEGALIEVHEILDDDWMRGKVQGTDFMGVFPKSYVEKVDESAAASVVAESEPEAEPEPVEVEASNVVEQETEPEPEPELIVEAEPEPELELVAEPEPESMAAPAEENKGGASDVPFMARAIFDFESETEGDLPFREGDLIEIVEVIDDAWWRGSLNGAEGIFPVQYVQREEGEHTVATPARAAEVEEPAAATSSLGFVVAQYDFDGDAEGDLPFRENDRIHIVEIIDDDWIQGEFNGSQGLVPRSYVGAIQHD